MTGSTGTARGWALALMLLVAGLWFPDCVRAEDGAGITPAQVAEIQQQADSGNADAQAALGMFHHLGRGVKADAKIALDWLTKAAEQGHVEAQNMLGNLQFSAQGVKKPNDAEALKWYEKAAAQGHLGALSNLGLMHYMGLGVPEDHKKAAELFRKAAEAGHGPAQQHLGMLLLKGEGVTLDRNAARQWLKKAQAVLAIPGGPAGSALVDAATGTPILAEDPLQALRLQARWPKEGGAEAEKAQATLKEGDLQGALEQFTSAFKINPKSPELARAVARLTERQGNAAEALKHLVLAVDLAAEAKDPDPEAVAVDLGLISRLAGQLPEAAEQSLAKASAPPESDPEGKAVGLWRALMDQGLGASLAGDHPKAVTAGRQGLTMAREQFGAEHFLTHAAERDLGVILAKSGAAAEAEELLKQAEAGMTGVLGAEHPEVLGVREERVKVLEGNIRYEPALALAREVLSGYEKSLGPAHPFTLEAAGTLARLLQNQGRHDEGIDLLEKTCPA
ncbi:MAG: SEL1-like repeat protein, partial [Magnetococcales bacterium]|nr:SEL1-like repeat protein [Magnetococcales bacterium]